MRNRGLTSAVLIVVLVVVTTLSAAMLRSIALRRLSARAEERLAQAERLAESAIDRAAYKTSVDPAYSGETWRIEPERLGGLPARIEIRVEPIKDDPKRKRLRVQADYPVDGPSRARRSRETVVSIP